MTPLDAYSSDRTQRTTVRLYICLFASFQQYSPGLLKQVGRYADTFTEGQTREKRLDAAVSTDTPGVCPDDLSKYVPSKVTIAVKEITDNRYYHAQWRKGDEIKSKCNGPAK
jgi:hypothetical protein